MIYNRKNGNKKKYGSRDLPIMWPRSLLRNQVNRCHLLVLAGLICLVGSLCWCLCWRLSCPGLRPISRPCDLCPELVQSRARKRSKTLALQAEAQLVKTIMGLYMRPVVGRLLAYQMPQILLRIKRSSWASLMRWRRVCGLRGIPLGLSLCAILLNESSGDGRCWTYPGPEGAW
ncbi:hypothetical protein GmHk_14G041480 [Glycine max]|nr:hypothetical protein GmHk_14G041480 [Glycine max]